MLVEDQKIVVLSKSPSFQISSEYIVYADIKSGILLIFVITGAILGELVEPPKVNLLFLWSSATVSASAWAPWS